MFLARFFALIGNFKERLSESWDNFWCYTEEVRDGKRIADNGKCRGVSSVNGGCLTCKYYVGYKKGGEDSGEGEA